MTLTIAELGPLEVDDSIPEWLMSQPVPVPLLDGLPLAFTLEGVEDDPEPQAFADAVRAFLALGPADRAGATPRVFRYYRWYAGKASAAGVDLDMPEVGEPEAIWAHVRPTGVMVTRGGDPDLPVHVALTANCDWDAEHGLQLIYRAGRELARVSYQDGHVDGRDTGED